MKPLGIAVTVLILSGPGCAPPAPPAEAESGSTVEAPPTPAPVADLVEDVASLEGMFVYMADAATFTECRSGSTFAVAMEGGYLDLERSYLEARPGPGEPLWVRLVGRRSVAPGMEGGPVPTLFVEALQETRSGAGCGGTPDPPLEGTEWLLTEVVGVTDLPEGAHASLSLDPEVGTASGSSGCNRFTGSYRLDGGRLQFGMAAVTGRACAPPLMALETDYLEALRLTGSYRLVDGRLELLGEAGPVARFRPR